MIPDFAETDDRLSNEGYLASGSFIVSEDLTESGRSGETQSVEITSSAEGIATVELAGGQFSVDESDIVYKVEP